MIWGCMLWKGVGYATRFKGRMDGELYRGILEDELQNSIRHYHLNDDDVIFQQDNDPKHTSRKAKDWFEEL